MSISPPSEVTLEGHFYTGTHSDRQSAILRSVAGIIMVEAGDSRLRLSPADVRISPRIGNTPRYLHLPDDGVFETEDNNGVDLLDRQSRQGRGRQLLHRLESHLGLILLAVVVTLATTGVAFVYGVPWAAHVVANALPTSVAEQAGRSTLATLDSTWLEPSTLSTERQAALQDHFRPLLMAADTREPLRVLFRHSPAIGANAMALPDGTMIFTDDLVNLAQHDDELSAILAHEIGHVAHRHGLQGMVQGSLTFWLIVMMTGDLSAFSDATVVVPAVLMSLAYSREMEREADTFALNNLQENGIDSGHFANIMIRLMATADTESSDEQTQDSRWDAVLDMLSSHPGSDERIERFRHAH